MRRREFIARLGSVAAWPMGAQAQQRALPMIGFVSSQASAAATDFVTAFRNGLAQTGFTEGRNVEIEYRWAEDRPERLQRLAADLVGRRAAVIVAVGGPLVGLAVRAETESIPLVFTSGVDPVKLGLVESFNRPGGNATGVNILITAVETKRFGLLRELSPASETLALILNPHSVDAPKQAQEVDAAAVSMGKRLQLFNAGNEGEIDTAFAKVAQARAGALLVGADPLFMSRRQQIVALAARYGIPAIYEARPFTVAGGLMSYGPDMLEAYRVVGIYAGRILKGEKPADLPVVQPTKLELVINLKTAKALGLIIPETLLATADEVIQ
jgi:putative tryptophan/tyrosine transport system substrate-binding protein